jgi:hypothetical protein
MPSTVTWVGGTSGDWDKASNWSSGKIPGAADDVVINTANATITHSYGYYDSIHSLTTGSSDTLNWSTGSLNISSASTLNGAVNLLGGTWFGGGNVTLDGLLTWTGGTMTGSGTTTANAGINLTGNSTSETLDGRTLNNGNGTTTSTATWSGTNDLYLQDGAVFNNQLHSTFNISNDQTISTGLGTNGTLKNSGTVNESGQTHVEAALTNSGTVNVNAGLLNASGGGSSGGTFYVAAFAQLDFGGFTRLNSSSSVTGAGTVQFFGATSDVSGSYNLAGMNSTTSVTGSANFTGNLASLGTYFSISGGTASISKNVSISQFALANGALTGSGAVTVTTMLDWYAGGAMSGTGSTTLASGAVMDLGGDGTTEKLDGRTFNNKGTVNWLSGSGNFELDDGVKFNNESGATFSAQSGGMDIYSMTGATPSFNNAGTFIQAASAGTTLNGVLFNNSGTVNIPNGTLTLDAGGTDTAGVFNVASGAELLFGGGYGITHLGSNIGTSSNPSAGSVVFAEFDTEVTGTCYLSTSGTTDISNGDTVYFLGTLNGGTVNIYNGRANIAKTVTIPTLNLFGGVLAGAGAVTVTHSLTWNNGSYMVGTGSTTLAKGATMSLSGDGSNEVVETRTFNNYGNAIWEGSSGNFSLLLGAIFDNEAGASFTVNNDQTINDTAGATASFNNMGTFTKSGTTGTTEFANVVFNNTGTMNVNSGTLQLDTSGNDSSGAFKVASGATLHFAGGITTLASAVDAASSSSAGTVLFSAGTTDVSGIYNLTKNGSTTISGGTVNFLGTLTSLGGTVTISGGTANLTANATVPNLDLTGGTLTGSGSVTVTSSLTWNGGSTMSGTGSTTVASTGTANLNGTPNNITLDGRTFNDYGVTTYTGSSIMEDNAVFNNEAGATFTASNNPFFYPFLSGGLATFNNAGTFNASSGTWFGAVTFNNSGTVNVATSGSFEMDSGGSNSGAFVLGSGSELDFYIGYNDFSAPTASITGAGSVIVDSATVYFGGTYDITGNTTVGVTSGLSIGTAYFLDGGSTGTLGSGTSGVSNGTMELAAGTTFTVTNGYCAFDGGILLLNGGTLSVGAGNSVVLEQGASLGGPGTIDGNLDNGGGPGYTGAYVYVGGGQFPGTLTVNGNYQQDSSSTLIFNIGGATAGTQFDQMKISGTATLAGFLDVHLINGYNPSRGTFDILTYASESGDFADKILPSGWSASPGSTDYVATA